MNQKVEPENPEPKVVAELFHEAVGFEYISPTVKDETIKNPNLDIALLKFLLTLPEHKDDKEKKKELLEYIRENEMAPFYETVCKELNWKMDKKLHKELRDTNFKSTEAFDAEIDYAHDNLGATDIKEAYLNKANYLSKIGNKEETIKYLSLAFGNTVALGYKLDNVFHCIRIGLFFHDIALIKKSLMRAQELIEEGADWHYRNCFKIYKGLFSLTVRDFPTACLVFSSATSTFVCTELIKYDVFIKYTILSSILTLKRHEFKKEIIDNPDVQEALLYNPTLKEYAMALYNCEYQQFFAKLADVEKMIKEDMLMYPHYQYYVREMKIKAYNQLLSSYISVSLSYMSHEFGVSEEFIENDISKYIAARRLNYKIDKVNGTILNIKNDSKQQSFENVLKHGDCLLNRIQKLGRVINI